MGITIRDMTEADLPQLVSLLGKFAEFEHLEQYFDVTVERLRVAMFEDGGFVEGLMAFDDGEAIAHALFFPEFASFRGQRGYFVEDIFILEEYRGRGIGDRMLREIARRGAARGFERLDLVVLRWNAPALDFYRKRGAVGDDEVIHYKFTDDSFRRLADEPKGA